MRKPAPGAWPLAVRNRADRLSVSVVVRCYVCERSLNGRRRIVLQMPADEGGQVIRCCTGCFAIWKAGVERVDTSPSQGEAS